MRGKGLTVSTDSSFRFAIAVKRSGIIQLGPGFGFPAAWADDFSNIITADLTAHFLKVGNQVLADQ